MAVRNLTSLFTYHACLWTVLGAIWAAVDRWLENSEGCRFDSESQQGPGQLTAPWAPRLGFTVVKRYF